MRKTAAVVFTALVVLLASATAVKAADMVEIRGPVAVVEDGAAYAWGPQEFAGFYYDINDDIGRESITLTITGEALDVPNGVLYTTEAQQKEFDFEGWGRFWAIGFLGDAYFAAYVEGTAETAYLFDDSNDTNLLADEKLSRVIFNDDEERTLHSNTILKLAEGYKLAISDLDGDQVQIRLTKDGEEVDSDVVGPFEENATLQDEIYTYKTNLGDAEDVVVIAVHFKNAFLDADQKMVTIDAIWQISDEPLDVGVGDEYERMTIQAVDADAKTIVMKNENSGMALTSGEEIPLMGEIRIKISDRRDEDAVATEDPLRFCIYRIITEPGIYEVRGRVAEVVDGATYSWGPQEFSGFYYDIDDDIGSEKLTLTITGDAIQESRGAVYETAAQKKDFDREEWGHYYTIAFLGAEHFAAYHEAGYLYDISGNGNLLADGQLSEVLIDEGEDITLTTRTPLRLAEGYELTAPIIGVGNDPVYVQLKKDGSVIDSSFVKPSKENATIQDKTYIYKKRLGDGEEIVVIAVHFKDASFTDAGQNMVTVDGVWQISDVPTVIGVGTEFGMMTVDSVDAEAKKIGMNNEGNKITLSKNIDVLLTPSTGIRTADQDVISSDELLRFFIYEEHRIGDELELITIEPKMYEVDLTPTGLALVEEVDHEDMITFYSIGFETNETVPNQREMFDHVWWSDGLNFSASKKPLEESGLPFTTQSFLVKSINKEERSFTVHEHEYEDIVFYLDNDNIQIDNLKINDTVWFIPEKNNDKYYAKSLKLIR
jgi:S-layer protein (TIGR01567 family)